MSYRYPEDDPLGAAKQRLLAFMNGCADPTCAACKNNAETIDEFVKTVRAADDRTKAVGQSILSQGRKS